MNVRIVNVVVAALVAVGVAACGQGDAAGKKGPPPAREAQVLSVAPSEVRDTGEYLGQLVSRQTVTLLPQVAGYVRKIHVRPGQKVEAGAPLIDIDARQESAALESAQAQVRSARTSLELARQTLTRTEALYKEGLVSAQELDRARASVDASLAAERSATAGASQRQVQLQFFGQKAPFAGTMGDVLVRVGDYVTATTPLTSIAQADTLEVNVAVPAERARAVEQGTVIEVLDDAGQVLVSSQVYFVAPQADPRTQLVDVKAVFRNPLGLRPSELVRARVVYGVRRALQVPALAVVRQSGQAFVFAVQEKGGQATVQRRPVTLGALGEQSFVVEQGLAEGDLIAVSGLQMLRDGSPIQMKRVAARDAAARPPTQGRSDASSDARPASR